MGKLGKRSIDQATPQHADDVIGDDELPGFGLRVFTSGRRGSVAQNRAKGRTRHFMIGTDGVWTPETARREARVLLGRIARGDNPAEQRERDHRRITVKELCGRHMADAKAGGQWWLCVAPAGMIVPATRLVALATLEVDGHGGRTARPFGRPGTCCQNRVMTATQLSGSAAVATVSIRLSRPVNTSTPNSASAPPKTGRIAPLAPPRRRFRAGTDPRAA